MLSLRKTIGMEKIPRFSLQFHKLHLPLHRIPMGKSSCRWRMNILCEAFTEIIPIQKNRQFF